jgi:hypothetical protein
MPAATCFWRVHPCPLTTPRPACTRPTEEWEPIAAPQDYRDRFTKLWAEAERRSYNNEDGFTPVRAEHSASTGPGPTPASTGLGLPLARALAKAGHGWLSILDKPFGGDRSRGAGSGLLEGAAAEGDSRTAVPGGRWVWWKRRGWGGAPCFVMDGPVCIFCAMCFVPYALCSVLHALCSVLCALCCVLYAVCRCVSCAL